MEYRTLRSTGVHVRARTACGWTNPTLDAIDELVPPGTVVDGNDRRCTPWWFEPSARRR